jgi:hypothetical protein
MGVAVRPLVNVCANRERVDDLGGAVGADDEIRLIAAIAGG